MLLRMDAAKNVWSLLKHSPDPRVRSYIIHWLSPRDGDVNTIITRYEKETDVTIKRALLLCLGEFELVETHKQPLIETLLNVYRNDPDAGLHAAAEWLLRQWKQGEQLAAIDEKFKAKIAERELFLTDLLKKATMEGDYVELQKLETQKTREISSLKEECEAEKEKIRSGE